MPDNNTVPPPEEEDIGAEFHLPGVIALKREEMWGMVHDDNFHTALVTGCAGSGKTTVSVCRLIRLNNQSKKVRLLTFQNMLVVFIKNLVVNNTEKAVDIEKQVPLDRISTFHDWFYNQRGLRFDIDHPPSSDEIHVAFRQKGFTSRMPAELLIDEGQDLPLWVYEVLPEYYTRFLVGADPPQGLKRGMPPDHVERIKRFLEGEVYRPFQNYPLGQNFRNTYEIYRFARQFLPREYEEVWKENILAQLLAKNHRGPKPMVIPYTDTATRDEHMRKTLDNRAGAIVGVLCPIGPKTEEHYSGESVGGMHELITSWGIPATPYHAGLPVPNKLKRCIVTTFISSKGLEFDTVIVPRMNFFRDPATDQETRIREEMYVACTRAKIKLYVYRDQRNPQRYDPIGDFDSSTYVGPDDMSETFAQGNLTK